MIPILVFLTAITGWREDFVTRVPELQQMYEYEVNIGFEDGQLVLDGDPKTEGGSCAWFYVDGEIDLRPSDVLIFRIKVRENPTRVRYLYLQEDGRVYRAGEEIFEAGEEWQERSIPLNRARPFYSSNYPFALTPGKTPFLYFFIDNARSGKFDARIDWIELDRTDKAREEK
jgi:hypothetical protein